MKELERRWQLCAARARLAPARSETVPLGFAARVLARGLPATDAGLEAIWERLAIRWLAALVGVLVICAALELPNLHGAPVLKPGIENTVSQLVWKL